MRSADWPTLLTSLEPEWLPLGDRPEQAVVDPMAEYKELGPLSCPPHSLSSLISRTFSSLQG